MNGGLGTGAQTRAHAVTTGTIAATEETEIQKATKKNTNTIAADDPRVARPIFTLRETGAYLGQPKSTIHRWARSQRARR